MPKKTKCGRCGKFGEVTWANYIPYCKECLAEKSKGAIPFEEALYPEETTKKEINDLKKRILKLENEVKKLKK
ncbi:hypothetical protein J4456_04460 [Candidatus Pacearchaeota archaeon]|nr:hypothetical protein [Candidatus Pacearchaeota archaeon]